MYQMVHTITIATTMTGSIMADIPSGLVRPTEYGVVGFRRRSPLPRDNLLQATDLGQQGTVKGDGADR
jgi:hypothetical protein